ncbi:MAG: Tex family protein [Anaerolineae bacterium]
MDSSALAKQIAKELHLESAQVARTIALFDEGNTIPFVARYRKEVTGNLDEEQLRSIEARLAYLRNLDQRKQSVLASIAEQGKLTDDLQKRIEAATLLQEVEDLYLPYKPKRRTRATVARERGLEPLAQLMLEQNTTQGSPALLAANYVSEQVPTVEDALAGARDIVAEVVAEGADARAYVRTQMLAHAALRAKLAKKADDADGKYRLYYDLQEPLANLRPHRVLAINRGEREGILDVNLELDDAHLVSGLQASHVRRNSIFKGELLAAIEDGYHRLMRPSIEREVRAERTAQAESHAIQVFGANLRSLLLQPPLHNVRALGLDPGFRTGTKVAAVDETGKLLATTTIYPHEPQKRWAEAKRTLLDLVRKLDIQVLAIGNGTASRETESLAAELIADGAPCAYVMVSEAGASVYSASRLAGAELPQLDVSLRGAVSIARRLQDPLAELVKVEPRSIGVGLYQHDVDQKELEQALEAVVESAVNHVGVDVNTASPELLRYVSGLTARVAAAIVAQRDEKGPFHTRQELLAVKGLGAKAFQQAAGFLKIRNGADPLDSTFIHPESYGVCHQLLALMGLSGREADLAGRVRKGWEALQSQRLTSAALAARLGIGVPTLEDMLSDLLKPGRDPRDDLPAPILRTDVLKIEDLREGMQLRGTVRNVVDFGAFVDIGVKHDGLVHVSEMADRYVHNPLEVVSVGDVVDVRVLQVDVERGRVSLTMKH